MLSSLFLAAALASSAYAVTVAEIQGTKFQSTYAGESVSDVWGIVTAKTSDGFYMTGDASSDDRESNGIFVYTTSSTVLNELASGDSVYVSGEVQEYRSNDYPNDLTQTEISATTVKVESTGYYTAPYITLGADRTPPLYLLSALDTGNDGWLSVPNDVNQVDTTDGTLEPTVYGLDFWESLEGQLVKVPSPTSASFNNNYGEFWVYGNWTVTGKNARKGLTITIDSSGLPDGTPEVILVGTPLDNSTNPTVAIGTTLSEITGVIQFQYGFFYLLPLTAPTIEISPSTDVAATNVTESSSACSIRIGDYNVDNYSPDNSRQPLIASQIVEKLGNPDIVFLQEIQDNSGPTDDGVTSANVTLSGLVDAIAAVPGGVTYSWIDIDPINDEDGGETGGNIRPAYLYNPKKVTLVSGSPAGTALDATEVISTSSGLSLSYNPGRIDPTNEAWNASRKPIVAAWQTTTGEHFFTINVQFTAKLDSTTTFGNARPPVNSGVDQRTSQVNVTVDFVKSILALNSSASIIFGGDFNEFTQTTSVFAALDGVMQEADVLAGIPPVERYTYNYYQSCEQLDHIFVSSAIANRGVEAEHVHVNQYSANLTARASDHDPTIAKFSVC